MLSISPFLSRTWGSRERVEKTTTRTASLTVPPPPPPLLHTSYSRREAAVPRFDAPTWPNWKKPVSSSRSSFFACILAFCAASASTSLQLFLLFSVLHGRLFLLSLFLSLLLSFPLFSLSFFFLFLLFFLLPSLTLCVSPACFPWLARESGRGVGESLRDFMIRRDQIHLSLAKLYARGFAALCYHSQFHTS